MAAILTMKLRSVSSLFLLSHHHDLTFLTPLSHFSTQIQQKEDIPFIAQYLISSFGLSQQRAFKIASDKNLAPIKTPERPEFVIRFLKDTGLTDAQIKNVISLAPQILSTNVRKTLEPRVNEVIAAGFTRETLIQLIRCNPLALTRHNTLSKLQFWKTFLGTDEAFSKVIKNRMVFNMDIDKKIIPRINVLREFGLSDQQIAKLTMNETYFFFQSPDTIKSNIEQVEKLGFPPRSKMFLNGLAVLSSMKKDTVDKKVAFFKTNYGWCEEDINLALKGFPRIAGYSEENVKSTMDFLIRKVGLNPRSIASWPKLIGYSLARRLVPRHYVLTVLKSKDLENKCIFYTVANFSEHKFIEKYILPYKEELPNLWEEYAAACAGKLHLS